MLHLKIINKNKQYLTILLLSTFTFLSLTINVYGDVRYRGNAVHPDFPGQCYYEELQQEISRGQTLKPINTEEHCEAIYCRQDYVLEIQYCGRHSLFSNETCKLESDLRLTYPKCCPKLVCQTSNYV